jgi:hypothetical protein
MERRVLPTVSLIVVLTEKEAVLALPFIEGKQDYIAFFGKDLGLRQKRI